MWDEELILPLDACLRVHIENEGKEPWATKGANVKFAVFWVPNQLTLDEFLRGIKEKKLGDGKDVTEFFENGNGGWTKGSTCKGGEKEGGKGKRLLGGKGGLGWDARGMGMTSKAVWIKPSK